MQIYRLNFLVSNLNVDSIVKQKKRLPFRQIEKKASLQIKKKRLVKKRKAVFSKVEKKRLVKKEKKRFNKKKKGFQ